MVNYKKRLANLQALRGLAKVNAWLLSSKEDVFYYTGYMPVDNAFLLVKDRPTLFASLLENEAETVKCVDVSFLDWKEFSKVLKKCGTIGYDEKSLLTGVKLKLKGAKLKPSAKHIQQPRQIKEPAEIREIRKALLVTRKVRGGLRLLGRSEDEIARDIRRGFLNAGHECAFEPIVSAGRMGFYIHHRPGRTVVRASDMVIVDMGAKVNGYCCDTTETYCEKLGKRERSVMKDVKNMQEVVADRICSGVKWKDITGLYEKEMKRRGYKIWHSVGHSIGLSAHEDIGDVLKPGMVLALEPGVYIKGLGGCRFEDMILVRKEKALLL